MSPKGRQGCNWGHRCLEQEDPAGNLGLALSAFCVHVNCPSITSGYKFTASDRAWDPACLGELPVTPMPMNLDHNLNVCVSHSVVPDLDHNLNSKSLKNNQQKKTSFFFKRKLNFDTAFLKSKDMTALLSNTISRTQSIKTVTKRQ